MKTLLREFEIGQPSIRNFQTVDAEGHIHGNVMVFWPLLGPPVSGIGFWGDFELDRDLAFNRLRFRTGYAGPVVIPQGLMLMGEGAQDRAVPDATVFRTRTTVKANCLEPNQGGLFGPRRRPIFAMLPVGLRVEAHRLRRQGRTDTLWPSIRRYNIDSRIRANSVPALLAGIRARITAVDTPAVHPEQRGVAVTLNSVLLGIEIAPTSAHFARWWYEGLAMSYAVEAARKARPLRLGPGRIEEVLFGTELPVRRREDGKVVSFARQGLRGQAVHWDGHLAYATVLAEQV